MPDNKQKTSFLKDNAQTLTIIHLPTMLEIHIYPIPIPIPISSRSISVSISIYVSVSVNVALKIQIGIFNRNIIKEEIKT